jgi:hypothetical protein
MKKYIVTTIALLFMLIATAGDGRAEINQVQMKIAGYLCGN